MNKTTVMLVVSAITCGAATANEPEQPPYPVKGLKGMVTPERLPASDNPTLQLGAKVWVGTCKVCHGGGLAGAPKITGSKFWSSRLEQGLSTLLDHATDGFQSSCGGYMPPRGGNDTLSDEEVEAAVRFMIYHSGGKSLALESLDN